MRIIKHRGKTKDGEWVYGYYLPSIYEDVDIITVLEFFNLKQKNYHVLKETVGQFTGLLDKNGKEIYEGDIVQCGTFRYKVIYEGSRFASFALKRKEDTFLHYFGEAMESAECEVIGNIHDTIQNK